MEHLLYDLCRNGRTVQVEALLRRVGSAPLLPSLVVACAMGHAETARVLLAWCENNSLADGLEARGTRTPLLAAAAAGHVEVVRVLLEAGADPSKDNGYMWTPLHDAASGEVAAALVAAGARLEAANALGHTPLETALEAGRVGAAEEMLARGARITQRALATGGEAVRREAARRDRERMYAFVVAAVPRMSQMELFERRLVRVVAEFASCR